MTAMRYLFILTFFIGTLTAVSFAQPGFDECEPVFYYDDQGTEFSYKEALPTNRFAVRVSSICPSQIDTVFIGFGIVKKKSTFFFSDTLDIVLFEDKEKFLEDKIRSLSFQFLPSLPPDTINPKIRDNYWGIELSTVLLPDPPKIVPPRDFWVAWRFRGPSLDSAKIHVVAPQKYPMRSMVLLPDSSMQTFSSYAWGRVFDSVDLKFDARVCCQGKPIELEAFNARYFDGKTHLSWQTASESNNQGFRVERLYDTQDGAKLWQTLEFVTGHGTTSEAHSYAFIDEYPEVAADENGIVQYRLRQVDFSGNFSLSPTESVQIPVSTEFASLGQNYPNPLRPQTTETVIPFTLKRESMISLEVYTLDGRLVESVAQGIYAPGSHEFRYQVQSLPPGLYLYTLTVENTRLSRVLTKFQ